MRFPPTPCEPFRFEGRLFYVKRDDLSHPYLSGNKYRKLHVLLNTPSAQLDTVVSYGGVQSNAMLALAALCRMKGWRFEYAAKTLPGHLANDPQGNLGLALSLGMQLCEVPPDTYDAAVAELMRRRGTETRQAVVPQGGADVSAREGVRMLAEEIRAWQRGRTLPLTVATPSGTGTTAAFLAEALPEYRVVTATSVGDGDYLVRQIEKLLPLPPNLTILSTPKKYRFGKPDPDLLRMFERLKAAGIVFDLLIREGSAATRRCSRGMRGWGITTTVCSRWREASLLRRRTRQLRLSALRLSNACSTRLMRLSWPARSHLRGS